MATSKSNQTDEQKGTGAPVSDTGTGDSAYQTEDAETGKPIGPEHDGSFSAPDFYDPESGERIGTPWDSEQQKADKGIGKPGETERPEKSKAGSKGQDKASDSKGQDKTTGASGGESGEVNKSKQA